MSFQIEGQGTGGAGRGSFPMTKAELLAEFGQYLDALRAGEFRGNEFRVVWDQADEPHVFGIDLVQLALNKIEICRVCGDIEGSGHTPERRVVGSRR